MSIFEKTDESLNESKKAIEKTDTESRDTIGGRLAGFVQGQLATSDSPFANCIKIENS